jgi:hypothetical protein
MTMDWMDQVSRTAFLGPEFLLWLWWRCEEHNGVFSVGDESVEVVFDDQLTLESHLAEAEQSRLKGGSPAHSPEAHTALQMGKNVSRARMRLLKGEREWAFQIDTPTFRLSGLKLPALLTRDEDEKFHERMYLIEELESAWHALFRAFLEVRLGSAWGATHAEVRAWIEAPSIERMRDE